MIDPARKKKTMKILGRWKVLIDGVRSQGAKKKSMVIAFKWRRIVNKLLRKDVPRSAEEKTRILGVYGRWRTLTRGLLDMKEGKRGRAGTRHLAICAKWFRMAERMLCRHDPEYRSKRVQERWNKLINRLKERGQLEDPGKWRKMISKNPLRELSKGDGARLYPNNLERWKVLVSRMIEPSWGMLMGGVNTPQNRWNRLIGKLLKRHPSIAGGLWIKKFSGTSKKTRPSAAVLERWKVLIDGLAEQHGLKTTNNDFYSYIKGTISKGRAPDVKNLKVKKITYKNKEVAEENIRKGKERLAKWKEQDAELDSYRCRNCRDG